MYCSASETLSQTSSDLIAVTARYSGISNASTTFPGIPILN